MIRREEGGKIKKSFPKAKAKGLNHPDNSHEWVEGEGKGEGRRKTIFIFWDKLKRFKWKIP